MAKNTWKIERFTSQPLITAAMLGEDGDNINGPSIIRVPKHITSAPGKYLCYFGHHEGQYIRLAYADALEGPWHIYPGGVLHVKDLPWHPDHVASPDVHLDGATGRIVMYFHSPIEPMVLASDPDYLEKAKAIPQKSFMAWSLDGLHFTAESKILGDSYFRVWAFQGRLYALPREARPLYVSPSGDPLDFRPQDSPLECLGRDNCLRHVALLDEGERMWVFYTRIGDAPERILASSFCMSDNPAHWEMTQPEEVLRPELPWEGCELPIVPSRFGCTLEHENALRDPYLFREGQSLYLFYCGDAERAIGAVRLQHA
ncbi:MAG: hypothetical protein K6G15_03475 [Desulfovibrio sp.]|nr:hypothetical protein [Desulfovibrio sp.]